MFTEYELMIDIIFFVSCHVPKEQWQADLDLGASKLVSVRVVLYG